MRLMSISGPVLIAMAGAAVAEVPVAPGPVGLSQVSFNLTTDGGSPTRDLGFDNAGNRDLPFDLGRPDGPGVGTAPVRKAAKTTLRVSQARSRKSFSVPWQTGVFQ